MALRVIVKREVRDTVLSRRYLIYIAMMFIPVAIMGWLSRVLYDNPSVLARVSAAYPEPITAVTSTIAMMFLVCGTIMFPTLITIVHAGNFIAGDQEKGMLLLLASKPIKRWQIIVGKYLAFLIVFIPLVVVSLGAMYVIVDLVGIGRVPGQVFTGFLVFTLGVVVVYTSFATLLSSVTNRPMEAILGALILFVVWFTFDFIMVYLPTNIADVLSIFSLSYHANTASAFVSGGEATLRMMHVVGRVISSADFLRSLSAVLALAVIPVAISLVALQRRDIHAR